MADITKFLFLRHLRADPTAHIRHLRRGRMVHDGPGQAFWFRPLTAAMSEIPIDDREQPLLFHGRTLDFQDVTVQATVTYRVADPAVAAARIDFGIDPERGTWRSTPLERGASLVITAESDLVLFGDGIESDAITLGWGQRVTLAVAERRLRLLR